MTKDRTLIYLLLGILAILPVILLPIVGAEVVESVTKETEDEHGRPVDDGEPVRLVTVPLLNATGKMSEALVAVIDLPNRAHADRLCESAPYLNDTLHIFAAENPERTDPRLRVPGQDPELRGVLRARFPGIAMDAVRLTEPTAYKELYPSRDVYECQGLSYRRIAMKSHQ